MEKFELAIETRFIDNGKDIATELPNSIQGCRRWMILSKSSKPHKYAPKKNYIPEHEYSILDFEIKEDMLDKYFGDEDMLNQKRIYFKSLNELLKALEELKISPKAFTYPWKCDSPF